MTRTLVFPALVAALFCALVSCSSGGSCSGGGLVDCDDSNVCTDELCVSSPGGCVYTHNADSCDDGQFCNGDDTCSGGVCVSAGDPCESLFCREDSDICVADCGTCSGDPSIFCCDFIECWVQDAGTCVIEPS